MEGVMEPELTQAVRIVLKYEIQSLLSRLSDTGEEYIVLTASLDDRTCGHIGSTRGEDFLQSPSLQSVKQEFLNFCTGAKIKQEVPDRETKVKQNKTHRRKSTPRCKIPQAGLSPPQLDSPIMEEPEPEFVSENGFTPKVPPEPAADCNSALDSCEKNNAYEYTLDGVEVHNHTNGLVAGTMSGFVFQAAALKPQLRDIKFEAGWSPEQAVEQILAGQGIKSEFDASSAIEQKINNFPVDQDVALSSEQIAEQIAAATALVPRELTFPRSPLKARSRRKSRKNLLKKSGSNLVDILPKPAADQTDVPHDIKDVPDLINKDKKPGNSLISITNSRNQKGSKSGKLGLDLMDMKSAFEEIGNMAKCLICNKILANKNNRTFHWRSHVGDKRYTCDICNKAFTHPSNMRSHRKIHTDEKTVPMRVVRPFRRRDYLLQHLERFHYNRKAGSAEPASDVSIENVAVTGGGSESNSN
ncbi:LOW QUALITY PROTEIN: IKZF-like protein [Mya arenaria]|uniref:IKZF-like protein n=1 Tax=Mya arenaria TaxID=6604 RepID=A0ABY7GAZ2_MYAAR|nr:LOW QUALITY PROTEIN: IKZF-like protein [Mya arenaria]